MAVQSSSYIQSDPHKKLEVCLSVPDFKSTGHSLFNKTHSVFEKEALPVANSLFYLQDKHGQ